MKKYLLISALAVAGMAYAGNFSAPQKVQFGQNAKKIETEVVPFEWKDAKTFIKEQAEVRAAQAAEYDMADWYYAPGAFYLGIYEGLGGYNLGMIQFPLLDTVIFYNYYGPSNWTVNGTQYAENTDEFGTRYWLRGLYYVPETSDHDFNPARDWGEGYKDTTLNMKGTMYANGTAGQYICSAVESKFLNGDNIHLTLCAMQTDIFNEPDYDGSDFWMVGASALYGDVYYNGTNMHLAKGDEQTVDTLGILVDNQGVMKIEEILFPIYNDGRADAVNKYIPDGAELRVAIFPLDEMGIHFEDTIATTVMTNADFISAGTGYEWVGTLHAKFFETDIFGTETQVPVWVDGAFYLQLTNFNETGCDFGFYSDYYCPTTATTVYQHDGKFSYRGGKGGGGNYGQNLGISFDAYFPTLYYDTTVNTLYAGVEAESVAHYEGDEENYTIVLYSNVNPDEWEVLSDADWVYYDYSAEYYEEYDAGLLMFVVDALPEGETGRVATVTVSADGATQDFIIIQGETPEGIEETQANTLILNNKTFDVLGREVDDNFKGVVIKNGKKIVR